MKRGEIGRYETTRIAGESVHAFVPHHLLLDGNGKAGRQKSDNMAVVSSRSNRSTVPPAEHLFQAAAPTSERSEQNE